MQTSIAPLLTIRKDLLNVPKLAANVGTLQTSVTNVQPLIGIKDKLLQVERGGGPGEPGTEVKGRGTVCSGHEQLPVPSWHSEDEGTNAMSCQMHCV